MEHTKLHISGRMEKRPMWERWKTGISGPIKGEHWANVYGRSKDESEERASMLIKCVNHHTQLVDALETLIALHNYQESEGPKPTYEQWKTAFESAQETLNNLKP